MAKIYMPTTLTAHTAKKLRSWSIFYKRYSVTLWRFYSDGGAKTVSAGSCENAGTVARRKRPAITNRFIFAKIANLQRKIVIFAKLWL